MKDNLIYRYSVDDNKITVYVVKGFKTIKIYYKENTIIITKKKYKYKTNEELLTTINNVIRNIHYTYNSIENLQM